LELSTIYAPIQEDLKSVEDRLSLVSQVDFPYLAELLNYCIESTGKKIRPVLTLFSGKFYNYNLDYLIPMASAVEIMHTATLVHDDAIDKAETRRGRTTVNKLWGDENSVLLGDYLFAEAGALTASTHNLRAIKLFAQTLKTISGGEINQAYNSFNLNQSRQQYFDRIAKKTAALFSMATESGACLSQAPEKSIQILIDYGYNLGVAFQIVDDIFDFISTEEELGKPVGSDLAQGTLTLPAIFLLERYPEDNPVKHLFNNKNELENIEQAIDMVRNSPIIEECYQVAEEYRTRACRNLKLLPDSPAQQSLIELADYVVRRRQ